MPFVSEAQRRFMWKHHPEIAQRWAHEYPGANSGLPMHIGKKRRLHRTMRRLSGLRRRR